MSSLLDKIKQQASDQLADIISIRRHLHANPELSFHEFNTSGFVWNKLDEYGIAEKQRMAETGVVALIKGKNPGKRTVALRADMDALPIIEANDVPYKSKKRGCHARVRSRCSYFIITRCRKDPPKPEE
jgi:metal-dependent amidase/aminoacylase/carboxypeptidase family protein